MSRGHLLSWSGTPPRVGSGPGGWCVITGRGVRMTDAHVGEGDLLDRLRSGDADAFTYLVRSWSPQLLRYARTFVSTDASAQEVVQETWLGVIRGLPGFKGNSSLRTWVFTILANQGRKRGVSDHRTVPLSSLPGAPEDGPLVDPDRFLPDGEYWAGGWRRERAPVSWGPESQVLSAEVSALITSALAALPPRQREVVTLRDVHDFSSEEVADQLGISVGNVRVLLHRGRVKVREYLEEYYRGGTGTLAGLTAGGNR